MPVGIHKNMYTSRFKVSNLTNSRNKKRDQDENWWGLIQSQEIYLNFAKLCLGPGNAGEFEICDFGPSTFELDTKKVLTTLVASTFDKS